MEKNTPHPNSLNDVLDRIAQILPAQRPIDVFIAQNTLRAFEHLGFEDAVEQASKIYGAQSFLTEQRYLGEYRTGRIVDSNLERVLSLVAHGDRDFWGHTEGEVLRKYFICAPPVETFQQVKWLLREKPNNVPKPDIPEQILCDWLARSSQESNFDGLYRLNQEAASGLKKLIADLPRDGSLKKSERFVLWAAVLLSVATLWEHPPQAAQNGEFSIEERMINPLLIRFCEEYLDFGFANQLMPGREQGMLLAFLSLAEQAYFAIPKWLEPLCFDIGLYRRQGNSIELLRELLGDFRVSEQEQADFLLREALSLKGWAGYISFVEREPDSLHGQEETIKPKLIDFLNLRLILKKYAQRSTHFRSKCAELPPERPELVELDQVYCCAYHIFSLLTTLGAGSQFLVDSRTALDLIGCILPFDQLRRRRLWHIAYEDNFYNRALNALSLHRGEPNAATPKAHFIFCLDDREESLRRHLEVRSDLYQTFGTAGFFGIDANYTLISGASAPYCPIVIKPSRAIYEVPRPGYEQRLIKHRRKQRAWYRLVGYVNRGSGSFLHGLLLSLAGCLSFFPMVFGVITPRGLQFVNRLFGSDENIPWELADLKLDSVESNDTALPGYTPEEMAQRVAQMLRGIGLVSNFSDLIVVIGHGSSSRNNPFRSAYDCGACGGHAGGVNARAFCLMANRSEVRALLEERHDIVIPQQTYFLGALHNTCSDKIDYFDLEKCPEQLQVLLEEVIFDLKMASKQNALERCRRFEHVHARNTEQAAHEVHARSFMLAEARPEYTHATNALCIVGPRFLTKGLFLDRRSFLVSYESKLDSDGELLLGILRPVVAVCGGINLQYLFSAMDNEVYGAGSKLPHNIVSLLGVMNGTSSDLRTGLPSQMVEIHEPVRLLLVVYSEKEKVERVIASDPNIQRAISGEWIKLVTWSPESKQLEWRLPSGEYKLYEPSEVEIPKVSAFSDCFLGRSGHLAFSELCQRQVAS